MTCKVVPSRAQGQGRVPPPQTSAPKHAGLRWANRVRNWGLLGIHELALRVEDGRGLRPPKGIFLFV